MYSVISENFLNHGASWNIRIVFLKFVWFQEHLADQLSNVAHGPLVKIYPYMFTVTQQNTLMLVSSSRISGSITTKLDKKHKNHWWSGCKFV